METINEWSKYPLYSHQNMEFPLLSIVAVIVLEPQKGRWKGIGIVSRECSHGPWQVHELLLSLISENETLELPLFILHVHPFLAIR